MPVSLFVSVHTLLSFSLFLPNPTAPVAPPYPYIPIHAPQLSC